MACRACAPGRYAKAVGALTRSLLAASAALLVLSTGAASTAAPPHANPSTTGKSADPPGWAEAWAARLSLKQQIGQLLITGFDGLRPPSWLRSALRSDRLSGTVLFRGNIGSRGQLRQLSASLREASHGGALVSVDQEGGLVRRVPFVGPVRAQSDQGSAQRVKRIARTNGRSLRQLGFSVNFAPVADVPVGSQSDIFSRAFRGPPTVVARKVVAAVRGYREGRVAAAVKHFPGLGAAPRNTDDAAVVIQRSSRKLRRIDLVPFRAAIAAGVELIMVSHATYPELDPDRIASQSSTVVEGVLRRELRYDGAVVTDALEARAALGSHSVERAAERSLAAGCDLLLMTRPSSYRPVFDRILDSALASSRVRHRVQESAARVLTLKRGLGLQLPRPARQ
jgi:beta-N-acetylhexosaminidase